MRPTASYIERGDIVTYAFQDMSDDRPGQKRHGIYLGMLYNRKAVIMHTERSGEYVPLLRADVEIYAHNQGIIPEYAPIWAHNFGKGRGRK